MKKHLTKIITLMLISALICCMIPTFTKRIETESKNTNVVVSLYYNDIANKLSGEKLNNAISAFKEAGVTTLSFSEENLNSMVIRGDVTNIKFNVLRHKFDDESLDLARYIENHEKTKDKIIYDSQLLITKDEKCVEFLSKTIPDRFAEDTEYNKIEYSNEKYGNPITVFCIYNGTHPTYDVQLGYNEAEIKKYSDMGFDICLVMRLTDNSQTGYIDNIARLVKQYNIKYISLRDATVVPENEADKADHYTHLSKLIQDNNLTLVVTENSNQLSNESPFGYNYIFQNNSQRVLRSYETYDASHVDATKYMFRYQQYLNSTIDRNIRFITVSQIILPLETFENCTEYTLLAVKEYINKIAEMGYTVNGDTPVLDYDIDLRIPNAAATAIIVLMVYLMICMLFKVGNNIPLFVAGIIFAVLGAVAAYLFPASLKWVFPTGWAVLSPCFALTVVLYFASKFKDKLKTIPLSVLTTAMLVAIMSIFGIVQSSLLSGIDYYINNDIFRGIKLSLFIPLIYAVVAYIIVFVKVDYKKLLVKIANYKISDIKIITIVAVAVVLFVVYSIVSVYIKRSGNVNSISAIETWMRNLITDIFEARPRTKEFLVGYPCLVLFVYYLKNTNIKLIQCGLFCGAAITAASISNSFCHVFTTVEVIYSRVLNGIIIGFVFCIAAYIANIILVKIIKKVFGKYILPKLEKNDKMYSMYKMLIGERN